MNTSLLGILLNLKYARTTAQQQLWLPGVAATFATMLNLTFQLLKLFAEGSLPATAVQILASAAFTDGLQNRTLISYPTLGGTPKGIPPHEGGIP